MSGRAGVDEQAEKVRVYREFVARRGSRDLGNGDYSVDPGWHTAAELLPVIDSLAAELSRLRAVLTQQEAALKDAADSWHFWTDACPIPAPPRNTVGDWMAALKEHGDRLASSVRAALTGGSV